jgi:pyruvate/2-oxoglutarate dehydrogenase complex dihydrolipoamide acyltransferase (E2) component
VTVSALPPQRRATWEFLGELRRFAPVHLDTEVDMSAVRAHQAGARLSVVTYLLWATARTLDAHPEANAAVRGRWRPRVARYGSVDGKLALDKTVGGQRVVVSAVLPGLHRRTLAEIQEQVAHFRDGDPATMAEFAPTRALYRAPVWLGTLLYKLGTRSLRRRPRAMGTFALTSLGHRPVDGFHSAGGTTITIGAGRISDRPVVRDGAVVVAPTMRLTLTFDHRLIDGALAADLITEIKDRLESVVDGAAPAAEAAEGSARPAATLP